eukprot:NODE_4159_length_603_cov_1328.619134_g2996_i0.p2 GENE.NODE_4159_length_603_cov_1328.619134_g2996_i0~~NODE_4159_length_603_cov_1328.619134_g2996_i0.p2  ORF type:complete len:126 (-),score=25.41 NODE_4159_length_603_cov_1328.619134_g2996_i0:144-521(-)
MDVVIKTVTGHTLRVDVLPTDSIAALKEQVQSASGLQAECQTLFAAGVELADDSICAEITGELNLVFRLRGGVMMEPTLQVLARKYNCDKMVCRKCYARLAPRATNCRNKMCGHCPNLRVKKKLK